MLLEVDQDHDLVRMSKFIEAKLVNDCPFEDRKAFYEVTENEEDLLYYRKILRPETKAVYRLMHLSMYSPQAKQTVLVFYRHICCNQILLWPYTVKND